MFTCVIGVVKVRGRGEEVGIGGQNVGDVRMVNLILLYVTEHMVI